MLATAEDWNWLAGLAGPAPTPASLLNGLIVLQAVVFFSRFLHLGVVQCNAGLLKGIMYHVIYQSRSLGLLQNSNAWQSIESRPLNVWAAMKRKTGPLYTVKAGPAVVPSNTRD